MVVEEAALAEAEMVVVSGSVQTGFMVLVFCAGSKFNFRFGQLRDASTPSRSEIYLQTKPILFVAGVTRGAEGEPLEKSRREWT